MGVVSCHWPLCECRLWSASGASCPAYQVVISGRCSGAQWSTVANSGAQWGVCIVFGQLSLVTALLPRWATGWGWGWSSAEATDPLHPPWRPPRDQHFGALFISAVLFFVSVSFSLCLAFVSTYTYVNSPVGSGACVRVWLRVCVRVCVWVCARLRACVCGTLSYFLLDLPSRWHFLIECTLKK